MAFARVLLIAQSPVLRIGIRGILESTFHAGEIVEADGAVESIAPIAAAKPDLVIIQDALPGITGTVAAHMVRELRPGAAIIVLSDHVSDVAVAVARSHGADALLPSTVRTDSFIATIQALRMGPSGETRSSVSPDGVTAAPGLDGLAQLRSGDLAILDGLARGFSPRDLASHLLVSEQTVRARTAALVRKLNAADRTSAVVAAVKSGMVDLSVQLPSAHAELAASV
jgi:DNA-binding NarL/FixJ family response regulator